MTDKRFDITSYDYDFPEDLIAGHPPEKRGDSRLLTARVDTGEMKDGMFGGIAEYFRAGDVLVLNETKVVPSRFFGVKEGTGARIELLIIEYDPGKKEYLALSRPAKRLKPGTVVKISDEFSAEVSSLNGEGKVTVKFNIGHERFLSLASKYGHIPLPPYIKRPDGPSDRTDYQTVYAKNEGSSAAPTAGLHFTGEILAKIASRNVSVVKITLHTGLGTFVPLNKEDIRDFRIHSEYYEASGETLETVRSAKGKGRVFCAGTTTVRTLEHIAATGYAELKGRCGLYIYPGFDFKVADNMITNFHLPRTSLLVMVSAFAGNDLIKRMYAHAVKERYRLFSYGDATLLLKKS